MPTTAGSGPFPDEDEQKLLTLLPPEYNNPAAPICERLVVENSEENVMLQYQPRAAIICYPRGGEPEPPDEVIFARYSSDRTADNVLDGVFAGVTVTDGTCPDQPTLTTYTQGEKESGRIGCFLRDSGEAYLEWTTQKPRVFAIAYNKNGKLDRLYEWWQSGRAAVG